MCGWVKQMRETREGISHDEHWVMFGIGESLYHIPETSITLYDTGIKIET